MGMKRDLLRVRNGARYLLIAAICAAAATACGSKPEPSSGAASAPAPPKVSLDITVSTTPSAPSKHWTLKCDPAGGTHPDPAAACAVLLKAKDLFKPLPKGIMCPMIRVGTKTAVIEGTYFGKHVDTRLSPGGCDLPRWNEVGQIFS
jgi:hypothetical protein